MQDSSTLSIQGYTPYAQVPRWILRAGDKLSHGSVRLYGVLMSYADNDTKAAFPGREKLSQDMGSNPRSASRFIKELEDFGALKVTRRRNKRTGNFYSNHYVLVFTEPSAENGTRRDDANDPITTPTVLPTPSLSFTPDESDNGYTSKQSFDTTNPGDLSGTQRQALRYALRSVGKLLAEGGKWFDDPVQEQWWSFIYLLESIVGSDVYANQFADLLENSKWTVSAKVTDPYEAGVELNKIISTGLLS